MVLCVLFRRSFWFTVLFSFFILFSVGLGLMDLLLKINRLRMTTRWCKKKKTETATKNLCGEQQKNNREKKKRNKNRSDREWKYMDKLSTIQKGPHFVCVCFVLCALYSLSVSLSPSLRHNIEHQIQQLFGLYNLNRIKS